MRDSIKKGEWKGTISLLRTNGNLVKSSISLSTAVGFGAFGGFIFWLLVARLAPASIVGGAAALYSSLIFITYLTGFGLPIAVARYGLSRKQDPSVLFNWSLVLTTATSFIGAALFLAIVPRELRALSGLGPLGSVLVFGVLGAGISISPIQDIRLTGQHRRAWVVGKAGFCGLLRIPFIFIPGVAHSEIALFLLAAGAPAICVAGVWILADMRPVHFRFPLLPMPSESRAALRYSLVNGAAQLAMTGPYYALPVIVLLIVSPRDNAFFYVAWTIATVFLLVIQGCGQALLVEGDRSGGVQTQTRAALRLGILVAIVLAAAGILVSRVLPILYGSSYVAAADMLPALSLSILPWAVFTVVVNATRVINDQTANVLLCCSFAISVLAPAIVLVIQFGINGAAYAFLLGTVISAAVALAVLRQLRKSRFVNATEVVGR